MVCWVVLGGLENRRFEALLWVVYTLALVIYITCLGGRFGAFWRHCGGGGLVALASRGFFTNITRARMMCGRGRACAHDVRACVRVHT